MRLVHYTIVIAALVGLLPFFSENVSATENKNVEFGTRLAIAVDDADGDFKQYEIFGALPLPWISRLSNDWQFEPMLDLSVGILDGEDETGGKFAAGVDLFWFSPERVLSLMAGIGAGVMTEEVYGDVDFGGPVFFRFLAGVNYWLNPSLSVGYRYLHESNGSMYDKNPSLNMHQFEIRLHF
jgi:hypothetical protein